MLKNNYNFIVWIYDFLAQLIFQNQIKKASCSFIHRIQPNTTILIIGGGTGFTLEQMLVHSQPNKIVFIEASRQKQRNELICLKLL